MELEIIIRRAFTSRLMIIIVVSIYISTFITIKTERRHGIHNSTFVEVLSWLTTTKILLHQLASRENITRRRFLDQFNENALILI